MTSLAEQHIALDAYLANKPSGAYPMFSLPGQPEVDLGHSGLKVILLENTGGSQATTVVKVPLDREDEALILAGRIKRAMCAGKDEDVADLTRTLCGMSLVEAPEE